MARPVHNVGPVALALLASTAGAPVAAADAGAPRSLTELFGTAPDPAPAPAAPSAVTEATPAGAAPASREALFGEPAGPTAPAAPGAGEGPALAGIPTPEPPATTVSGFARSALAYTYADPEHWSLFQNMLQVSASGRLESGVGWKAGVRGFYDPVYASSDFYPGDVRSNQKADGWIWETYLDASAAGLEWRVGRQQIVWGEMVALFFADVVSAFDMRQFILPDFEYTRLPQWAIRGEYFSGDFHAEGVWVPVVTYDEIGEVGSDFYPFRPQAVPGYQTRVLDERFPSDGIGHSGYGARVNYLKDGWDAALFFWSSPQLSPSWERSVAPGAVPTLAFRPIHERIHQYGGTVAKDFGWTVLKGELVYTRGRPYEVTRAEESDGLVRQEQLDYIVGLDFSAEDDTRLNVQLFQRWFPDHDPDMIPDEAESGGSVLVSTRAFHSKVEPELLFLTSLNRSDWNLQARVTWEFRPYWRLVGGVDIFDGPPEGLFGRFDATDRVYGEIRYDF